MLDSRSGAQIAKILLAIPGINVNAQNKVSLILSYWLSVSDHFYYTYGRFNVRMVTRPSCVLLNMNTLRQ